MRYSLAVFAVAGAIAGAACETTTTNSNVRVSNLNSNTAIVVNATATPMRTPRPYNANTNRADYDRDRAEYERDRGSSTIGQGVNDSWLWFKTRGALMTTDDLGESGINVDVNNDVVTLRGTVKTAAEKALAVKTARAVEGVKSVTDQLQVVPDASANSNRR